MRVNHIYCGDCAIVLRGFPSGYIDLVLTSPPYDNLREYGGYVFDFEAIAAQLWRVVAPGGVVVWIVGDATIDGSETGTSFRQALHFMELGFNLHDTMIWNKGGFSAVGSLAVRYAPVFDYMFVLSKGKPKTFNPIKDRPTKHGGKRVGGTIRQRDGSTKPMSKVMKINKYSQRFNIWEQPPKRQTGGGAHPAPFPLKLARDHIVSWTNPGDVVLDPMCGSGTTCVAAAQEGRRYIGIEINAEYVKLAKEWLNGTRNRSGQHR